MHELPEHLAKLLPDRYVNTPARQCVYRYDVDPALIVTFQRIAGLCWDSDETPPLKPDELALLLGLSRRSMYYHLKRLKNDDEKGKNPDCLGWIEITQSNRQIIIRPLVRVQNSHPDEQDSQAPQIPNPDASPAVTRQAKNAQLRQALLEIGIENPKRDQLACLNIEPCWVYAWDLWAKHPHRANLNNPVGVIIRKLEAGEKPPDSFLQKAKRRLFEEQHMYQEQVVAQEVHHKTEPEDPIPSDIHQLWARILGELELQMTHETYDSWLRGSQVIAIENDHLIVAVRNASGVDWLQNRLMSVIQRTVTRHTDHETEITFVAR
jgi:hypothetical protein